jgi:hypothetical protein
MEGKMKIVYVNGQYVQMNNASGVLTPEMAKSAVRMLYGHIEPATVTDSGRGFRVTKSSVRRLTAEEEYDAGID